MNLIDRARILRKLIERMAKSLDDESALSASELFPQWETDHAYEVGDRIRYGEVLYKVLLAHTSQADWTPDIAVSLYVRVDNPAEEWPEWVQPLGAQDAYMQGDKVSHNGKRWISKLDNNVWEPGIVATAWDEYNA